MPAGQGKTLLRCSIHTPLYAALVAEAKARHVDLGVVIEGRLDTGAFGLSGESSILLARLDLIAQQQEALLTVVETLVSAVTGGNPTPPEVADRAMPIATYDELYREPDAAVTPELPQPPVERKRRWPFSAGSHGSGNSGNSIPG